MLLTSVDQIDFGRMVLDFGIAAHLTKPARSAVLLGTVIAAIQRARSQVGKAHFIREPAAGRAVAPAYHHAARALPAPAPRAAKPSQASNVPLDILVAEDNEVNQLVFGQILSGLGLTYRIAGNGRTAVEMHRALQPKLILMDVSMPEMNGYEATRAIREAEAATGAHTPIIGVTAHALKGDREKCIEAGMDDYLPKPVSPDRLGAKIGTWLSETRDGEDGVRRRHSHSNKVGAGKVVALVEQRHAMLFGAGVGKAIRQIELRWMPASFAVSRKSLHCQLPAAPSIGTISIPASCRNAATAASTSIGSIASLVESRIDRFEHDKRCRHIGWRFLDPPREIGSVRPLLKVSRQPRRCRRTSVAPAWRRFLSLVIS